MINVCEIGRDGLYVRFRKRSEIMDDGRHWSCGGPVQTARAGTEIAVQFLMRPRRGSGVCGSQGWRNPIVDYCTGIGVAGLFGAKQVARGVTSAAMAKPGCEICAPVPFAAFAGGRFEAAGPEEEKFPPCLEGTDIERERKTVRMGRSADRRPRHKVGIKRLHI